MSWWNSRDYIFWLCVFYRLDHGKTQKGGRISIDTDDYRDQLKPDTNYEISVKSATNNRRQEIFVRTPISLDLSTITTREYVSHVSVEWLLVDDDDQNDKSQKVPESIEILIRKEQPESYSTLGNNSFLDKHVIFILILNSFPTSCPVWRRRERRWCSNFESSVQTSSKTVR